MFIEYLSLCKSFIDLPMTLLFLCVGIFLSLILAVPQFRYFSKFFHILQQKNLHESQKNSLSPIQALLTAMSTSLGMGSIAAPPVAIAIGGPGALFWLWVYAFFGGVIKFAEVTVAVHFKTKTKDGVIIGGPATYLQTISPWLGYWYGLVTIFLFCAWSGLQTRTLAEIYAKVGISHSLTGLVMALFIFYMLLGGAQRIADFASALVPTMCTLYLVASSVILLANFQAFIVAVQSIFIHAFTPTAALGGFAGSTVFMAAREGIFKGVFVTEAGMGTSSIPHAMAQTDSPKNQGILAMYSILVDTFFCTLSGLVALVTGVWKSGVISNALIFDAFSLSFPNIGPVVLLISITLFVLTTALGNSFNGSKSFSTFTNGKYITWYYLFACIMIFLGAITKTSTLWNGIEGVLVPLIAIPNLLGITYLIIKYKKELKLN